MSVEERAFRTNGLSKTGNVICAAVYDSSEGSQGPVATFCPFGGMGNICSSDNTRTEQGSPTCQHESLSWYQDAIYFASGRDTQGRKNKGARIYKEVVMGPGTLEITRAQSASWPFGPEIGIHIPSHIRLSGSRDPRNPTSIRMSNCVLNTARTQCLGSAYGNPNLNQLLLVSDERFGSGIAFLEQAPVRDVELSHFSISAFAGSTGSRDGFCESKYDRGRIVVDSIVRVAAAESGLDISFLDIQGSALNAIDLGFLLTWVPDTYATDLCFQNFCPAKRWMVNGTNQQPVQIHDNKICAAGLGGVTVIGRNVDVFNNTISVDQKDWTDDRVNYGVTMGISAAFAGSEDIYIFQNRIIGADYGIGTDGSYPLHTSVELYKQEWPKIYDRASNEFRDRYSDGIPLDHNGQLAFLTLEDFLRAQQTLFNLASGAVAQSQDPKIFDFGVCARLRIHSNEMQRSTVGISLYKTKSVWVEENRIERGGRDSFFPFGILIADARDSWIGGNQIEGARVGVQLVGRPAVLSKYGASFNGIGVIRDNTSQVFHIRQNIIENVMQAVVFREAGENNSVRHNQISLASDSDARACDYSGGINSDPFLDWTTGNSVAACNEDY